MARIIIDAGHGGETDSGAVYQGRLEKDDNLALALAVGEKLKRDGFDVVYTRTSDIYQSPLEKARLANEYGGDWFISFHRNSSPNPNTYSGTEILVYNLGDQKEVLAANILSEMEKAGYKNLGVKARPGLAVLRRTQMPAILIETGFINTDADNAVFDANFNAIAQAIVDGVEKTVGQQQPVQSYEQPEKPVYWIQLGVYRIYANALNRQYELMNAGYPADLYRDENGFYIVSVGEFADYEEARRAERALEQRGFEDGMIVKG